MSKHPRPCGQGRCLHGTVHLTGILKGAGYLVLRDLQAAPGVR
jgi:hypothetical protein